MQIVRERIEEFLSLEKGWYKDIDCPEGVGNPYSIEDLNWFMDFWNEYFEKKIDLTPFIYPMVDGGIDVEWDISDIITFVLEIDIKQKIGNFRMYKNEEVDDAFLGYVLENFNLENPKNINNILSVINENLYNYFKMLDMLRRSWYNTHTLKLRG